MSTMKPDRDHIQQHANFSYFSWFNLDIGRFATGEVQIVFP